LLGHSLGAAIASTLAGTFPDRIERLALVEGLGPVAEPARDGPERFAKALAAEADKRESTPTVHESQTAAIDRLARATGLPRTVAATLAPRGLRAVDGGVTWRSDPRLRLPSRLRLTEELVQGFLRRIACPVLVVRGTRGSPFSPRVGSERLTALRDARLVECEGGHHVHMESPVEVAASVGPFLRGEP
jgi:pimeloyl-ACP methyl ester carboxylesterase